MAAKTTRQRLKGHAGSWGLVRSEKCKGVGDSAQGALVPGSSLVGVRESVSIGQVCLMREERP